MEGVGARSALDSAEPIPDYVMEAYNLDLPIEQIDFCGSIAAAPVVLLAATQMQQARRQPSGKHLPRPAQSPSRIRRNIPNARLTRVRKTSHYIQLQRPDVVIDTTGPSARRAADGHA